MREVAPMSSEDRGPEVRPLPLAIGMLLGGLTGFLIWITTDTFALFPAFLGIGPQGPGVHRLRSRAG
jgi:hypothetical protein